MTKNKKLTLWESVSFAIGTMIGASIFSLLASGAKIAGYYLPLSLFISGILALMVAYSYANLGKKIISNAGPIAFILKAFGDNFFIGVLAFLFWFTYVVSLSLFAKGFAIYFCPIVGIENKKLVETLILLIFMVLNFFGSKIVGIIEKYMVLIKVLILITFIVLGFFSINNTKLGNFNLENVLSASIMFFISYIGFGLVTNASEYIENPEKNVPRAIYISIFIVMMIYLGVSFVATQNLDNFNNISENLLAELVKPILGNFGYYLISLGAILSTLSALNATLYGGVNVAYSLAKKGELPRFFDRKVWFNEPEGLYITTFLAIIFVLFFNIESVASITSLIFFIIYIAVLISHYKLNKEGLIEGNSKLILFNIFILILVFVGYLFYSFFNNIKVFSTFFLILISTVIIEFFIKKLTQRDFGKYLEKIEKDLVKFENKLKLKN